MILGKITKGKVDRPLRLMVFGPPGVGKSTFASGAPKPIFLDVEHRTEHLEVDRLTINSWQECLEAMKELLLLRRKGESPYETIVLDTADALEHLIHLHLCSEQRVASIEDYGGGYGKGYTATLERWGEFVRGMEALRDAGYTVVVLAHSHVRTFKNPEGEDYDRFELKMNAKSASYLRERVDAMGFATFEDLANIDKKTKKAKGVTTGERIIRFSHSAAFESKQGISVPDTIKMDWKELKNG